MMPTLSHSPIKTRIAFMVVSLSAALLLFHALIDSAGARGSQSNAPEQAQAKPSANQLEKPPVTKKELLTVLQNGGIPPERLLELVTQHGVDFQSSLTDEAELGKAGSSAELLAAVSANYRAHKKKSGLAKFNETLNKINAAVANSNQSTSGTTSTDEQASSLGATATAPSTDASSTTGNGNLGQSIKQLSDGIRQMKKKKQQTDSGSASQPSAPAPATPDAAQPSSTPAPSPTPTPAHGW